jgi:GNAT superfamily N-acetyltransferase
MQGEGYRLAALEQAGVVCAVAGFRVFDMLHRGRNLYVDDLVTDETRRSSGCGATLLQWLMARAGREGCARLDLDSGVQRAGAHRFYFREGMAISAYHFTRDVGAPGRHGAPGR